MTAEGEGTREAEKPPERAKKPVRRWLLALVMLQMLVMFGAAAMLAFAVDRFWLATVFAYLPRWLVVLPAVPLLALALSLKEFRLGGALLLTLALSPFIVGDFEVPSLSCGAGRADASVRLLTQNALRRSLKEPWLADLVKSEKLDVVMVQECDVRDLEGGDADPVVSVRSPLEGYTLAYDDGLCLFSRFPIKSAEARNRKDVWERGGSGAIALYQIEAPFGSFWILNLHLATVRAGIGGFRQFGLGGIATMRENTELRRWESGLAREWADHAKGPLLIAGDFNMPRESQVYVASWGSYSDAWETCGFGFGYTKETRVKGIEFGTRIDHVLFDKGFGCAAAKLGPEIGSDHRGLVVELRLR